MGLIERLRRIFTPGENEAAGSDDLERELLAIGTSAPSFALPDWRGQIVQLDDFEGSPVILVFYPKDNSPVCTTQLVLYNEAHSMFQRFGAVVLAISTDDPQSHATFARDRNLQLPLLADHDPKGAVARAYRALEEEEQQAERVLYVLDSDRRVYWAHRVPNEVNPGADGILDALARLTTNEEVLDKWRETTPQS